MIVVCYNAEFTSTHKNMLCCMILNENYLNLTPRIDALVSMARRLFFFPHFFFLTNFAQHLGKHCRVSREIFANTQFPKILKNQNNLFCDQTNHKFNILKCKYENFFISLHYLYRQKII